MHPTVILCILLFTPLILCDMENVENEKRSLPDDTCEDDKLDVTRSKKDFSKISEVPKKVKFPGRIDQFNEWLTCRVKCIGGTWVGPFCSSTQNGRFQSVILEYLYRHNYPLLAISFKNSIIANKTSFPHGSVIMARCLLFSLKLKSDGVLRCENGESPPEYPKCMPTTILNNFTGDSPLAIWHSIISGSATVEPYGDLFEYPDSNLHVDCVASRLLGDPLWTWTQSIEHYHSGWSTDEDEKDSIYRLTLSLPNSDDTCITPLGKTNKINIGFVSKFGFTVFYIIMVYLDILLFHALRNNL